MQQDEGRGALLAVLGLAAVAMATVGILWLASSDPGNEVPRPPAPPAASATPEEDPAVPPEAARVSEAGSEAQESAAAPPQDAEETEAARILQVHGSVLAMDGSPVPGVGVGVDHQDLPLAFTDGTGAFAGAWPLPPYSTVLQLGVRSENHVTLLAPFVGADTASLPCLLVAAPAVTLAGVVVDETETPLSGVELRVDVRRELYREFPQPLDRLSPLQHHATSDANGSFAGLFPRVEGAPLVASLSGYEPERCDVPVVSQGDLRIVLARKVEDDGAISGVVLLPDRSPAAGARVLFHESSTTSAEDGSFRLVHEAWKSFDGPLVATLPGHQAAVLPDVLHTQRLGEPVTLVLGDPPLAIEGRIEDAAGQPAAGWEVRLVDGTEISRSRVPPILVETAGETWVRPTQSAADGTFRLAGLFARDYRVRAYDLETLLLVESGPVPAGTTDLVLRVPADALLDLVKGRVVARSGEPLEGVTVSVMLTTYQSGGALSFHSGKTVLTDAGGGFEIRDVPRARTSLGIGGDTIIPETWDLGAAENPEQLEIAVARRCHFRLTLTGTSDESLSFEVVDAGGDAQNVYTFQGGGWSASTRVQVEGGATPIRAVSEDGIELRLYRGWQDAVASAPLELVPDEVAEVSLDVPAE